MSLSLKEKLELAWKNRGVISEGFFNAYISSSQEIKNEALRRLEICRTNTCGLYDPQGKSEKAVFKGKESCGGCGCDLYAKTHAMSANCFLKDQQIQNFKKLISEGYIQVVQDGFIKKGINSILSPENIASLGTATDTDLWLVLQAIRSQGIEPPIGQAPLWEALVTQEQEMEVNKIAYQKQTEHNLKQTNQQ